MGHRGRGRTRVQPDADPHGHLGHVAHLEGADGAEDVQGHVGDLAGVPVPVALGQPRGHHVGVADGLHLVGRAGSGLDTPTGTRPPSSGISGDLHVVGVSLLGGRGRRHGLEHHGVNLTMPMGPPWAGPWGHHDHAHGVTLGRSLGTPWPHPQGHLVQVLGAILTVATTL